MKYKVQKGDGCIPLTHYLRDRIKGFSAKAIKRAIEEKKCLVNGKPPFFSSYKIKEGDQITFFAESEETKTYPIKILYEDEEIIAVDKPSGTPSQGNLLKTPYFLVHRLDKGTSGVFLMAKNAWAQKEIEKTFKKREVFKSYFAIVEGELKENEGMVENTLGAISRFDGGVIWGKVKNGKYAKTRWKVLKRKGNLSEILCFPYTGRTHQIRVHLSGMGYPIVGDFVYGSKRAFHRPLLHALALQFKHPKTQKWFKIRAPIPEEMKNFK